MGDMALIGPRPETLEHERWAEEHVPGLARRLAIAPGITGLAQVVQDSTPLDVDLCRERLRLNERYLASMGLSLDAWILLRAALRPFRPRPYAVEAPSEALR